MMNTLSLIISSIMNVVLLIHICKCISNRKIKLLSGPYILTVFLMTTYWSISYVITENIFRILIEFLMLVGACLILLKEKTNKSIIISFMSLIILLIAEIAYAIFVVSFFKMDMDAINRTLSGNFISNLCIVILALAIKTFICHKVKIVDIIDKLSLRSKNSNFYIFFIAFTTIIMLTYCIYFEANLLLALIFGIIIVVVYVFFTITLVQEKANNIKLQEENNNMVLSLEEYEKMYSFQRMKNHEYKNDLSILRGMINENDTGALKYIDKIIEFRNDEDHNWMVILKRIPEGGLQGLLYYKLLQMEEKNINIDFTTTVFYTPSSYNKLPDRIKIKICKLLGIYLDNSMQAVESLQDRNIYININENDKFIIFKIANNFSNNIDLDRLYEKGYTTKSTGHGYGLAIAKELITEDNDIVSRTKIIKDKFIQEIEIKKN